MTNFLEIERKFLLKRIPNVTFDANLAIEQYYSSIPGNKIRLRRSIDLKTGKEIFYQTKKTFVKPGVDEEDERILTKEEFTTFFPTMTSKISKLRLIKKMKTVKWEIDVFTGMQLIVAEVELPSEDYKVKLPKFITNELIKEVTGIKEFNNRSLSETFKSIIK